MDNCWHAPVQGFYQFMVNNGKVWCLAYDKDIKVGMGGVWNFLKQHNSKVSKACKSTLEKKKKANAYLQSQLQLQAFFTKQLKVLIPLTVPAPTCVVAYAMESSSSKPHAMDTILRTASTSPNTYTVNILITLEKVIDKLPDLPEASEYDEILMFAQRVPTNLAKEDAWEYLDPMLNWLLGFSQTTERISNKVARWSMGIDGHGAIP